MSSSLTLSCSVIYNSPLGGAYKKIVFKQKIFPSTFTISTLSEFVCSLLITNIQPNDSVKLDLSNYSSNSVSDHFSTEPFIHFYYDTNEFFRAVSYTKWMDPDDGGSTYL
jgi:hypothetical protein